jgi:hypothetical protein
MLRTAAFAAGLFAFGVLSSCPTVLVPSYNLPQLAPGWQAQLIANGFKKPRSLLFDSAGSLLVLDSGVGIKRLQLTDHGDTCVSVASNQLLVNQTSVRPCRGIFMPSLDANHHELHS